MERSWRPFHYILSQDVISQIEKSLNKIVEAMKKKDWNSVTLELLAHQIYDKIRTSQVLVHPYEDNRS